MADDRERRRIRIVPDPLSQLSAHPIGSSTSRGFPELEDERIARILVAAERISDTELVARCRSGDENAWRLVVRRYQNLVYSTALEVGLDPDDAGDVFQEVWLELHRSMRRIRNPEALPRWLMVATRRLSYKVAARGRRMVSDVSSDLVDPGTLPDDAVEIRRARHALETALELLGGRCERLLRLLFFTSEKTPYEEISKETGLAVGSIGPVRGRCLARLRRILEGTR
jgi:RNA polymerase sigma factor (sigma-70 family)